MLRFIASFFGAIFSWITIGLVMAALTVGAVFYMYGRDLPNHEQLSLYAPPTISRIYSGEGRLIDEFAQERRLFTPIEDIPDLVKHAFISAEDKNFYLHKGYDVRGMLAAARDALAGGQVGGHQLQPVFRRRLDHLGHQPQRGQDMPVRRIARRADAHPVAAVEQRRERQQERPRRPGGDDHARRVQVDPVPVGVQPRDPRPQRRQPQRHGITHRIGPQRRRHRVARALRRGRSGLAHLHVDDMPAPGLLGPRGLDHIHHNEANDRAAS